mmetsp:Transcript_1511/g.2180  ORF Transcript_1511/g.2180 Transcript_1511/m.2180 type:complete len:752 (+) Transcript_1511:51-2306(+)
MKLSKLLFNLPLIGGIIGAVIMPLWDDLESFYTTQMLSQKSDGDTDFIILWKKSKRKKKQERRREKAAELTGLHLDADFDTIRNSLRAKLTGLGLNIFVAKSERLPMVKADELWFVSAPFNVLYRTAELIELQKDCMGQHGRKAFYTISPKTYKMFSQCPGFGTRAFFSSSERQRLVWDRMGKIKHDLRSVVPRLEHFDVCSCIPLHSIPFRNSILWEHIKNPGSQKCLDKAAGYFGTELAFYFAYLSHYTTWMIVPAVLGVALFILDYDYIGTSPYSISYAIILCLWMSLYIIFWTRAGNELKERWGVTNFKDKEILKEPRQGFQGYRRTCPISGKEELHSSSTTRYLKMYLVSYPITLCCLYIAFLVVTFTLAVQDYCSEFYFCRETPISYMPSLLYSLSIPLLDKGYRAIATGLTEWENHKTRSEHRDALIFKLTAFNFINSYLSLFYIFFWLQDLPRLKRYLKTLMCTSQIISIVLELGLPYLSSKYALYNAEKKIKILERQQSKLPKSEGSNAEFDQSLFVADLKLQKYDGLMGEYFSVLRDHGFVIMFGWCWGLAPLCALLANAVQLRFDMWKICTSFRRTLYTDSDGIGAWETVLRLYAIFFVAVIFAMLAMYELKISAQSAEDSAEPFCYSLGLWASKISGWLGDFPQLQYFFQQLTFLEHTTGETKLLAIVIIEHMLLAAMLFFAYTIPEVPNQVEIAIRRRRYNEHKLVRRQLQHSSVQHSRNRSYKAAKKNSIHIDNIAR